MRKSSSGARNCCNDIGAAVLCNCLLSASTGETRGRCGWKIAVQAIGPIASIVSSGISVQLTLSLRTRESCPFAGSIRGELSGEGERDTYSAHLCTDGEAWYEHTPLLSLEDGRRSRGGFGQCCASSSGGEGCARLRGLRLPVLPSLWCHKGGDVRAPASPTTTRLLLSLLADRHVGSGDRPSVRLNSGSPLAQLSRLRRRLLS